jgi:hypothetical protein
MTCWICGEPGFVMGGKKGLPSIMVCRDCFDLTNGTTTVKALKARVAELEALVAVRDRQIKGNLMAIDDLQARLKKYVWYEEQFAKNKRTIFGEEEAK